MVNIKCLEEKKWIMAYYYKCNFKKYPGIPKEHFLNLWDVWWKNDFPWTNDIRIRIKEDKIINCSQSGWQTVNQEYTELFDDIIKWLVHTIKNNDADQIKCQLDQNRSEVYIPKNVIRKADELGYMIYQCNTDLHPCRCRNSFKVVMKDNAKKIVFGSKKCNLLIEDINKFINKKYRKYQNEQKVEQIKEEI